MIKPHHTRVNLSSSFPMRSRCGKCKNDYYYYWDRLPMYFYDPRSEFLVMEYFRKFLRRVGGELNLNSQSKSDFHQIVSILNYETPGRAYKPRMHLAKGFNTSGAKIDVISCGCGACVWLFVKPDVTDQKEIINRKAKYSYPKKYYW